MVDFKPNPKWLSEDNVEIEFHKFEPQLQREKPLDKVNYTDLSSDRTLVLEVLLVFFLVLTVQSAMGIGSYSGHNKPPMFGDYEAQRHWMEVTYHLPLSQWYVNSSSNDLLYWGLDYPPLTAYHSYLMGVIAHHVDPSWVALGESRGHESPENKRFMRYTAILPTHLIYLPALAFFFFRVARKSKENDTSLLFGLAAMYPGLIVIDNGHFQYNSVSLGLFLAAVVALIRNRQLLGSFLFVLALNYKQMELYHSLPIFIFILARSIRKPVIENVFQSLFTIAKVGIVVVLTFLALWLPFILTRTHGDVLRRIFPFSRGVYEDKVASVWCSFSFIFKRLPESFQRVQILLSTLAVLLFSAPSLYRLFTRPTDKNFRLCLFTTSLSFFLFSFHVHEKTILQPAAAALLLLGDFPREISLFLHISNVSLFSLCIKDENRKLIVCFIAYYIWTSLLLKTGSFAKELAIHVSSIIGLLICLAELWAPVPVHLPHIYPLAMAIFCCLNFLFCLYHFTMLMFTEEQATKKKKEN